MSFFSYNLRGNPVPNKHPAKKVYKSGVVAIVGPPNAGKSTLLNQLLGQKIAIVTPKPQTTRNQILGIVTADSYQIILLDTPGLHKAKQPLNREMVRIAMDSLTEADIVLFLVDVTLPLNQKEKKYRREYSGYLEKIQSKAILALNKIDLLDKDKLLPVIDWYTKLHDFEAVIPMSALHGDGVDILLDELVDHLPVGPQYYPDDIPTDATERFIVSEIIREKIFLNTKQEIPYSTAVIIDSFQEAETGPVTIHATILVEQSSQKPIIIGRRGQMLKKIGTAARLDIEELLDCRVILKLWIKVKKKWTRDERVLRELGF